MLEGAAIPERRTAFETAPHLGRRVVGAKLRAARNRFTVTRRRSPVLTSLQFGLVVPGTVAFTALLTIAFASAFSTLTDQGLATTLLAAVLAMGAVGSFIGSSTTALQALYLADDIPFLLTLPIPLRVLYASKFLEAAVGALPPALLVFAGTLGYGLTNAEGRLFWVLAPVLIASTVACSTAVSVVVVSVVTRYIPPKKARLFLFAISLTVISVTLFGWRLLAPRPDALGHVVQQSEYAPLWRALAWTPAGWGAQAMSDLAHGQSSNGSILAGLHIAGTLAILGFASSVFQRTFVRGLNRTIAVQTDAPSETFSALLARLAAPIPQPVGALVLKEWLSLARDLRRLSGAIWPLGVVLVYTVLLGHNSGAHFESARLDFWSKNGSLALLPWGLSLGISVYAFGSEGRNVQLLRSLPVSGKHIYFAKAIASALPVGAVSLGAAITSLWFRQQALLPSLALLGVVAWMVAGYVLIDTAAAAISPNFDAGSVQRTITLSGRLLSFAFGGAFGLATVTLVARAILAGSGTPGRWSSVIHARVGGVEPLGWPLVLAAAAIAIGSLAIAIGLAIGQSERLLEDFG